MLNFTNQKRKIKISPGFLMALPSYLVYFIFGFIPIVTVVFMSFTNYNLFKTMDFVGLKNYINLFRDEYFFIAVKNTFTYSLFTIIPPMVIGLLIAVLLNEKIFARNFFRISFYIPHITAMAAISMVWLWMYDTNYGFINAALGLLGIGPVRWLFDKKVALISIIIMSIWKSIGYIMIIYLAALQQVSDVLYEAATIDGASRIKQFFSITVPMIRPTTFFVLVTTSVKSFKVFEQVMILTEGGPLNATTTIMHQIYTRAFSEFKMGYSSAMSVFLLVIVLLITLFNYKYGSNGQDAEL